MIDKVKLIKFLKDKNNSEFLYKIIKHTLLQDFFRSGIEYFSFSSGSECTLKEIIENIISGDFDIKKQTCKWEEQEYCHDEFYYDTQCKLSFEFLGGSKLNEIDTDFKYCPYCGKEIEEVKDEVD